MFYLQGLKFEASALGEIVVESLVLINNPIKPTADLLWSFCAMGHYRLYLWGLGCPITLSYILPSSPILLFLSCFSLFTLHPPFLSFSLPLSNNGSSVKAWPGGANVWKALIKVALREPHIELGGTVSQYPHQLTLSSSPRKTLNIHLPPAGGDAYHLFSLFPFFKDAHRIQTLDPLHVFFSFLPPLMQSPW